MKLSQAGQQRKLFKVGQLCDYLEYTLVQAWGILLNQQSEGRPLNLFFRCNLLPTQWKKKKVDFMSISVLKVKTNGQAFGG